MKVSAREIARGRWSLDGRVEARDCGCRRVVDGPVARQVTTCRQHDTARDEKGELR